MQSNKDTQKVMESTVGVEAMYDPDIDYHTATASALSGVPYKAVTRTMRKQSKPLPFIPGNYKKLFEKGDAQCI